MGVDRVVMMSGCPGAPGDSHANWITTEWPPEVRDVLRWQWDDVLIPYWRDLVAYARQQGVDRLCLELHGYQNVYNVATLKRLRDAVGETRSARTSIPAISCGWAPIRSPPPHALGDAVYYVHAKDTRIDPVNAGINGVIDTTPGSDFKARAWSYITLGLGHDEALVAQVRRRARGGRLRRRAVDRARGSGDERRGRRRKIGRAPAPRHREPAAARALKPGAR